MSYSVDGFDDVATFDSGTSVLVSGPSTLIDQRLLDVVTPGSDERTIVITTNSGAETVIDALTDRGAERGQLGIIDCTSHEPAIGDAAVRQLSSPGDLTGISLEFAKLLEGGPKSAPVRVGFESISTGLMYTEVRTMFRFLHVFTARIRSGDMLGVFTMDPGMHDEQAHNTIRTVFDCEVQVDDDDGLDIRGTGFER
jgi:hypothetical protein